MKFLSAIALMLILFSNSAAAEVAFSQLYLDGDIVGMSLFFYNFSTWRGEPGVYVQDMVVSERARGLGLGRRLLLETARHASRHGATHLRLSVDQDNAAAIGFYRSLGLDHARR